MGTVQPATTRLEMEANEDWILETFDFELASKEIRFAARGAVHENKLKLEIESAGHKSSRELVLPQAPYLLAALKPYVVTQQLETGKKFLFSTFDPSTLSQQVTTVVIEGREQIRVGNRSEAAIRLRQSFRGISVVSWVDGHGRTLKEESPAGLSLVRQDAQEAKNLARSRGNPRHRRANCHSAGDAAHRSANKGRNSAQTKRGRSGQFSAERRAAKTPRRPNRNSPGKVQRGSSHRKSR